MDALLLMVQMFLALCGFLIGIATLVLSIRLHSDHKTPVLVIGCMLIIMSMMLAGA